MPIATITVRLALCLVAVVQQGKAMGVHITTSDAIDLARAIARDEGYDVRDAKVYYFDLLQTTDGKPLLAGYTTIGFYINGTIRSSISINEGTGQAVDMNSCEIFDYPEVRAFQERLIRITGIKRKTAQELASDAGCSSPKVLNKPVPAAKK